MLCFASLQASKLQSFIAPYCGTSLHHLNGQLCVQLEDATIDETMLVAVHTISTLTAVCSLCMCLVYLNVTDLQGLLLHIMPNQTGTTIQHH